MAQASRVVAYAHAHGVLIRDLKPSNILWDPDAGPQVTDFGLAKKPDDRYPSAAALAEDLERFARGELVSAVPLTPVQKVWR